MPQHTTSPKKTSPAGIFLVDPTFYSHFLIKQERGERIKGFIERYREICLRQGKSRWQIFFNPEEAQSIFFLVGLSNRWLAREVDALLIQYGGGSFRNTVLILKFASSALRTYFEVSRAELNTQKVSAKTAWDWAQNRPNTPVYQLELLRYILLTGKQYTGPRPQNLPNYAPESSDEED